MYWLSRSPAQTLEAGARIAACLEGHGALVSLEGPLGAGKTVLAKGIAAGLGIDPDGVASPTFVIANEYASERCPRLVHADLYRLTDSAELDAAGGLDWLAPDCVALIEWGDRFPSWFPEDHIRVSLAHVDAETRRISVSGGGTRGDALRAALTGGA